MKKNPILFSALILNLAAFNAIASGGAYPQLAAASAAAVPAIAEPAAFPSVADRTYSPAVQYTSYMADQLAAMAGQLTQVNFVDGGMNGQDHYYYWGAPAPVRRVAPRAVGIMRHWTSNAQAGGVPVVDLIVRSGHLKAGPRPYIIPESHRADYYNDLHGVFFTTPDFPAGQLWMGLRPDSDYVDFVVDPAMGALYLAPGNYLFPCPLKVPGWMADAYIKWKQSGALPAGMTAQSFSQIEREGGLREPIDIPITVVSYQKNGRVTVLRPDLAR